MYRISMSLLVYVLLVKTKKISEQSNVTKQSWLWVSLLVAQLILLDSN